MLGNREQLKSDLQESSKQYEYYTKRVGLSELDLVPAISEYGIVVLPDSGKLTAFIYEIIDLVDGKLLPDLLSQYVSGAPSEINKDLQTYAERLLVGLLEGARDYDAAKFYIDDDLNPENVIYEGSVEEGRFRLIDTPLTEYNSKDREDGVAAFVESSIALSLYVLHWDMIGLSVIAHTQDDIYLEFAKDCGTLRKALPRNFSEASLDKINELLLGLSINKDFNNFLRI